jgi:hypothetical protein
VGQAAEKAIDRTGFHKVPVVSLAKQYFGRSLGGGFDRLLDTALRERESMSEKKAPGQIKAAVAPTFREQRIPVRGEFPDILFRLGLLEEENGTQYANAPASMMAAKLLLLPTMVSACYRAGGKERSISISQLPPALRENASDVVDAGERILVSVKPIIYNHGVLRMLSNFTIAASALEAPFCTNGFSDACLAFSVFNLSNRDAGTVFARGGPLSEAGANSIVAKSFVSLLREAPEVELGSRKAVLDLHYEGDLGWVSDPRVKVSATNVLGELGGVAMVSKNGAVYCACGKEPVSYTVYSDSEGSRLLDVFSKAWKAGISVG